MTTPTQNEPQSESAAQLLNKIFEEKPRASYAPNGLPPIDEARHSPEIVDSLQHRAMEVE